MHELVLFKMLAAILIVVLLVLLMVWAYRYVQYRRAVRLSQMRWLHFEAGKAYTEAETQQSFDWPTTGPMSAAAMLAQQQAHILSPILEERGRESMDSLGSARRDLRPKSYVSYGSMDAP